MGAGVLGITTELPPQAAYLLLSFHVLPAESILLKSLPTACLLALFPHLSPFILFCTPLSLIRAICETTGLKLFVGTWKAHQ